MYQTKDIIYPKKGSYSLAAKIFICVLICIQLFPPILVLDSTSLRHFLIALLDISALGYVCFHTYKYKSCPIVAKSFSSPLIAIWFVLLAYMGVSLLWTINPIEGLAVWNRWIVVIVSAVLACNFLIGENKTFKCLVVCTLVIAAINVLSCIICYYAFDVHISQRNNLKLHGFYGNKNIFAVALLFKLPFLYYAFLRYKGFIRYFALGLIFSVAFCLVIISTRSSFIGLGLQIAFLIAYAIYAFFAFDRKKSVFVRFLVPIVIALAGFFSGNAFIKYNFEHYAKNKTVNNYTVGARLDSIAEGNSKGRLLIWHNTWEIIKQRPWTGYGVGNHKLAIMKVECAKKSDYIVSDHAHNDFLEMFSELGVFGLLIYGLTYLLAAVETLRQVFSRKTREVQRLRAMAGGMLILTYLNDALFNFPLERADCQIYLAIGLGLLLSGRIKASTKPNRTIAKPFLVLLTVVMVPVFVLEETHCYSSVMQKRRILQHNGNKNITLTAKQWDRRTPKFPNIDESTHPRAVNIAERYASEKRYREAIDILLCDNSNPYYSLREYRLANYYNKLGDPDSASVWANRCTKMKPLCYFPVRELFPSVAREGGDAAKMKLIDEFLLRNPKEPLAWEDKAKLLLKQKNYQSALQTCDSALSILRNSPKIRALRGKILAESKENANK